MTDARPDNIVNRENVRWSRADGRKGFGARRQSLARAAGARMLGCSLYELEPGQKAFPFHAHHGNEEAYYILEGTATMRLTTGEFEVNAGDYIALPPGHDSAHQLINNSSSVIRYLCMSTMVEPDVVTYPESDKIGVFAGVAPGGDRAQRTLTSFVRATPELDYLDGEGEGEGEGES